MTDEEKTMDTSDSHDSAPSVKKNGRTSLLDSGEDFELLDKEDIDDNPPPLEDARGGKGKNTDESEKKDAETDSDPPCPVDEWLDVLGNYQLKKKVLKAGEGRDSRPQKGQNVKINLKTSLKDGTLVEEQFDLCFTLGDGDIMQALDLTVQLMEMGEKALVQTDAKYAYGAQGSHEPMVPPDAELSLEVELLEATDAPDLELLNTAEKLALANQKKERGNFHYRRGDYAFAVNSYSIALQIIELSSTAASPEEETELLSVRVMCLNNTAASQLKMEHHDAALKSCVSALDHQPDNIKALFRMGKVLAAQREYTEAIQTLRKALKLTPSNKIIHAELARLVKEHAKQQGVEQAMCKRMLGSIAGSSSSQKHQAKPSWGLSWKLLFGATAIAIGGVALSVVIAARN